MRKSKVALGTMAGIAIGTLAGLLFAPEKGSVTRKQIIEKGDDYVGGLKSKFNGFRDSPVEKMQKDAEELADKGKAKYNEAKKEAKSAASNIKHNDPTNF